MCSIAGSKDPKQVKAMLESMIHRAPDGTGIVEKGGYTIGMGRLAIIDLKSKGLCPYQENGMTIAFNGEIYNYLEIRKELKEKGYEFTTDSDTEVLLKAYKEWGIKCLEKFNGMFAFAIYDGERIFLARDIAGEKPLYYDNFRGNLRFASEAKALNFECQEFPPAHYATYNLKEKVLNLHRYWDFPIRGIDPRHAEEELEWLLEDSIKLRTRSDVPYGLYYSGGIDSSLIDTFHDFKFKFTYEDKDFAEEFKKIFPKILWHLDYPVDHFSPFALWKLAELAHSKGIKVILSGEGADEIFGGYVRYIQPNFNAKAREAFPSYKAMFTPAENIIDAGKREFYGNMQQLLRMGDRMASAFGVENRCPFLDKRIIEFGFSLPEEMKLNGFETKSILRRILERRNPEYKHIEKTGLFCAVNKWIGSKDGYGKKDYLALQKQIYETIYNNSRIF